MFGLGLGTRALARVLGRRDLRPSGLVLRSRRGHGPRQLGESLVDTLEPNGLAFQVRRLGTCGNHIDKTLWAKLCGLLRGDAQVFHKRKHVLADGLVVLINGTPVLRLSAHLGFTDACQDGTKNLFP